MTLSGPYPLAIGARPDRDELLTSIEEEEVLHDLARLGYVLPPDIGTLASRFTIEAAILMLLSSRIAAATAREDMRSAQEHRPWQWESFLEDMRRTDPKWWSNGELPKTLSGRNMAEAARSTLGELQALALEHFQPGRGRLLSRTGGEGHGSASRPHDPNEHESSPRSET